MKVKTPRKSKSIVRAVSRDLRFGGTGKFWYQLNFSRTETGKKIETAHRRNACETFDEKELCNARMALRLNGSFVEAAKMNLLIRGV